MPNYSPCSYGGRASNDLCRDWLQQFCVVNCFLYLSCAFCSSFHCYRRCTCVTLLDLQMSTLVCLNSFSFVCFVLTRGADNHIRERERKREGEGAYVVMLGSLYFCCSPFGPCLCYVRTFCTLCCILQLVQCVPFVVLDCILHFARCVRYVACVFATYVHCCAAGAAHGFGAAIDTLLCVLASSCCDS